MQAASERQRCRDDDHGDDSAEKGPTGRSGGAALSDTVRRVEVGDQRGGRAEHANEHRKADAKHRPVSVDAAIGVDRTNRPYRRERREDDGHSDGDNRSGHDRSGHADETV